MTPEEIDTLAERIAGLLGAREWVPETVRPEPPSKPGPESLPSWAGAAQHLDDVAPVAGRSTTPGPRRPEYGTVAAAARGAAAGTAPSPRPGGSGGSVSNAGSVSQVSIGVSARHVHVTAEDFQLLFGLNRNMTELRSISQPGQFAANERVKVVGPSGAFDAVRIVGPARDQTQVEMAASDYRVLGVVAPIRYSGNVEGSGAVRIEGPEGSLELKEGAIVPARHLHVDPPDAASMRLTDGDRVDIALGSGDRRCNLLDVLVRAGEKHATELHIDTDEAHAFGVTDGDTAYITRRGRDPGAGQATTRSRRRLITERDVGRAAAEGWILKDGGDYIITPAAKDRAKSLGVWRKGP